MQHENAASQAARPDRKGNNPAVTVGKRNLRLAKELYFHLTLEGLARQNLLERPLNPIDFFADYSDRLLVFRWMGQRSDSFQSVSYLMIPRPNERQPRAPLLAISVNSSDELSGKPRKYQTKQRLNRNTIRHAVKL